MNRLIFLICLFLFFLTTGASLLVSQAATTASSTDDGASAAGAMDGDRYGLSNGTFWRGRASEKAWWWQVEFDSPRLVGAIEQIVGDHPFVFHNAPRRYQWQGSLDGHHWFDLFAMLKTPEERIARMHRLRRPRLTRWMRMNVAEAAGDRPTLREVVFHEDPQARVSFPEWIVVVNVTDDGHLPGQGEEFIPLAQSVAPALRAQQILLTTLTPEFLSVEPKPLCVFLSGSFKDWCEVDRSHWRGTQSVMKQGRTPMWASCGGAQALGLISEYGVDRKWDCPHCPRSQGRATPLYGHIGHTAAKPCGEYSACVFERGPFQAKQVGVDPIFAGLSEEFTVMESHCGQLEWTPAGWDLVATSGAGTKTEVQCVRKTGTPIYAAQFHIEMTGAEENSKTLMRNFLTLARRWVAEGNRDTANPSRPSFIQR